MWQLFIVCVRSSSVCIFLFVQFFLSIYLFTHIRSLFKNLIVWSVPKNFQLRSPRMQYSISFYLIKFNPTSRLRPRSDQIAEHSWTNCLSFFFFWPVRCSFIFIKFYSLFFPIKRNQKGWILNIIYHELFNIWMRWCSDRTESFIQQCRVASKCGRRN